MEVKISYPNLLLPSIASHSSKSKCCIAFHLDIIGVISRVKMQSTKSNPQIKNWKGVKKIHLTRSRLETCFDIYKCNNYRYPVNATSQGLHGSLTYIRYIGGPWSILSCTLGYIERSLRNIPCTLSISRGPCCTVVH